MSKKSKISQYLVEIMQKYLNFRHALLQRLSNKPEIEPKKELEHKDPSNSHVEEELQGIVVIPLRKKNAQSTKDSENDARKKNIGIDTQVKKNPERAKRTKAKKVTCDDCGHSFFGKSSLQRHINAVHLKLKPFKCRMCKKRFSTKGNLKKHVGRKHLKKKESRSKEPQT